MGETALSLSYLQVSLIKRSFTIDTLQSVSRDSLHKNLELNEVIHWLHHEIAGIETRDIDESYDGCLLIGRKATAMQLTQSLCA